MNNVHSRPRSGPTFMVWKDMVKQAHSSGLPVFDSWRRSFDDFVFYMGEAPSRSSGLRLIEPELGFRPGNVVWDN